jgi:thiosulfate reductase cytochrome b subunit
MERNGFVLSRRYTFIRPSHGFNTVVSTGILRIIPRRG